MPAAACGLLRATHKPGACTDHHACWLSTPAPRERKVHFFFFFRYRAGPGWLNEAEEVRTSASSSVLIYLSHLLDSLLLVFRTPLHLTPGPLALAPAASAASTARCCQSAGCCKLAARARRMRWGNAGNRQRPRLGGGAGAGHQQPAAAQLLRAAPRRQSPKSHLVPARAVAQSPAGPNENGRKANPPKTKNVSPRSQLFRRSYSNKHT